MTTSHDVPPQVETSQPIPKTRPLWFNRDYMLLWSGQTISSVGSGVSGIALPFLVLFVTHSPAVAGYAFAIRAVPYLIFSLPAGALIDRWNRKLVMILCDAGRALALGSIPVALAFGQLTITQIFIVAGVEGTLFVFFNLAEVACLPRVVPKVQLPAATGQNQATEGIASFVAPPLGGLIYGLSHMLPFVADAISYAVSVGSLFLIKAKFQSERTVTQRRLWVEIREGLVWLWHKPLIRYMAILTGVLNFVSAGSFLIVILLVEQIVPHSHAKEIPFDTGLIVAIGSIGAIVGSVIGGFIQKRFSFGQVILATLWVQAIFWPFQAIAPNIYVLGLLFAGIFITGPVYNVVQFSYRLALIPDELQGRVNSVFRLLAFGFQPLGAALTGVLLQYYSPAITIYVLGGILVLAALFTTLNPLVRNARPIAKVEVA